VTEQEIRDKLSLEHFGKPYSKLCWTRQKTIIKLAKEIMAKENKI